MKIVAAKKNYPLPSRIKSKKQLFGAVSKIKIVTFIAYDKEKHRCYH